MNSMRSTLAGRDFGANPDFRWRGTEVSRLEGLTDAVLGFAINADCRLAGGPQSL